MSQDFSGQNLRGRSFKGQNLEGANFSGADIRSADFTGANLRGANFKGTKAGLPVHSIIGLLVVTWFFSTLLGLTITLAGLYIANILIPQNIQILVLIPWLVILVILSSFFILIIYKSLKSVDTRPIYWILHGAISVAFSTYGSVAAAISLAAILVAVAGTMFAESVNFIGICIASTLLAALISTYSAALTLAIAGVISISSYVSGFLALATAVFGGVIATQISGIEREGFSITAIIMNATASLMGLNAGWKALAEDETWSGSRSLVIKIAVIFGTKFCGADLTDVNFAQAKLKNVDFKGSDITRTYWYDAKELHFADVETTYLKSKHVRQLVITGKGQDTNFDRQNLRGVNLKKANLEDASFIGSDLSDANLQDANLSRAKLVQTQLDGTDFTGATLTGAYIQDWGITTDTLFDGVRCEYVYMRLPTKENPDPLRKPDNHKEVFADGEFGDFIKPIFDTLDLYHNQGVDPRAIAIAFKELAENNLDADLRIVGMEVRGEDKFLLRAKTVPDADKSQLSAEYFDLYNQYKALPKADLIYLLAQKDGQVQSLEIAFRAVTRGLKEVAETPKKQSNFNLQGAQFAGGLVDAETVTANQIGGNITNYTPEQRQNLAEAAAEIQQLLNQLGETYPTNTPLEKQIVVTEALKEIERNPTLKARVIGALKAGGTEALKELLDHPAVNVLLASIEGWQEAE